MVGKELLLHLCVVERIPYFRLHSCLPQPLPLLASLVTISTNTCLPTEAPLLRLRQTAQHYIKGFLKLPSNREVLSHSFVCHTKRRSPIPSFRVLIRGVRIRGVLIRGVLIRGIEALIRGVPLFNITHTP